MSLQLTIRNRQRTRAADLRLLRAVVNGLFSELPQVETADLGIFLVAAPEMTRLNETFLQHSGPTDVITLDYLDCAEISPVGLARAGARNIHGEVFLCVDEAVTQARRFRTNWQSELVRYLIHGVLHLLGHDDRRAATRRHMKRAENRLLKLLSARFALSQLARKSKLRP
jgi:probable rRNA maturation factor